MKTAEQSFNHAKRLLEDNGDLIRVIGEKIDEVRHSSSSSRPLFNKGLIAFIAHTLQLNLTDKQLVELWNDIAIIEESPSALIIDCSEDEAHKWFAYIDKHFEIDDTRFDFDQNDQFVTSEVDFQNQVAHLISGHRAIDLVDINVLARMVIANM